MTISASAGLTLRGDSTPTSAVLISSPLLIDGDGDTSGQTMTGIGTYDVWASTDSFAVDVGSAQRIVAIDFYTRTSVSTTYGYPLYWVSGKTVDIYTSSDNSTWTLLETAGVDDIEVLFANSGVYGDNRFQFRIWLQSTTANVRYIKVLFNNAANAVKHGPPNNYTSAAYILEMEVWGLEGVGNSDIPLYEAEKEYIPASFDADLPLLSSWDNIGTATSDLFLFEIDAKEEVTGSAVSDLYLFDSYGYEGGRATSNLFLLEAYGYAFPLITGIATSRIYLLESYASAEFVYSDGVLPLLESYSSGSDRYRNYLALSDLYPLESVGDIYKVIAGEASSVLPLLEITGSTNEIYCIAVADLYTPTSETANYFYPFDGAVDDVISPDFISLEYSNAF